VTAPEYSFEVSVDHLGDLQSGEPPRTRMTTTTAADAMAAWSKAITDGAEYAVIEALRVKPAEGWSSEMLAPEEQGLA
jgi:hypothetical protein